MSNQRLLCPACNAGVLHLCYLEVRDQQLEADASPDGGDSDADESYGSYAQCCDYSVHTREVDGEGKFLRYTTTVHAKSCGAFFIIDIPSRDIYSLARGDSLLPHLRRATREQALLHVLGLRTGLAVSPAPEQGPTTVETPTRDGRIRTKVLRVTYNEED